MATTPQTALTQDVQPGKALTVRRFFTSPGVHPFDAVAWETRDARIGHGDKVAFEQTDVEFPTSWSQNATNIVSQKYFRGQLDSPARERHLGRVHGLGPNGSLIAASRTGSPLLDPYTESRRNTVGSGFRGPLSPRFRPTLGGHSAVTPVSPQQAPQTPRKRRREESVGRWQPPRRRHSRRTFSPGRR